MTYTRFAKFRLIEKTNPLWNDLYESIIDIIIKTPLASSEKTNFKESISFNEKQFTHLENEIKRRADNIELQAVQSL